LRTTIDLFVPLKNIEKCQEIAFKTLMKLLLKNKNDNEMADILT
jgi:hypothetical protein